MPSSLSLREFLRREVKRSRIKINPRSYGSSRSSPAAAPRMLNSPDSFIEAESVRASSGSPSGDSRRSDGLVEVKAVRDDIGIYTTKVQHKERLDKIPADKDQASSSSSSGKIIHGTELHEFRGRLETLVARELEVSWKEKVVIRRQKSELIQQITMIEAKEEGNKVNKLKAHLNDIAVILPEPFGPTEKKTMELRANRVARARAGLETCPQKRNREATDLDFDGEDRLRLGKAFKKHRKTQTTGHWNSSIHDYVPNADGDGEAGKLENLTAPEKQFLRRELAELGEKLAKAERKKRTISKA